MVEPFIFFMRSQQTNPKIIYVTWHIFSVMLGQFDYARRIIRICLRKDSFQPESLLPIIQLLFLTTTCGLWWGLCLWWFMHGLSVYWLALFSTPVHRSAYGWTVGCESIVSEQPDFGQHTIMATDDYHVEITPLWAKLYFFGSFNDHITHHLFPTVNQDSKIFLFSFSVSARRTCVSLTHRSISQSNTFSEASFFSTAKNMVLCTSRIRFLSS